jgi:type IV pilus assembly protein PilQ
MTQGGSALGLMFGTIGGNILDMQLMALQRDGKLNILSSPSITTLDNQMAFTENGEKIPYVSTSGLAGTQVQFQDAVLRLEITPHVISDDVLKMKIVVKNDQVDPTRTVAGNPYIIKKQTDTTLICRDGETIVISGLTKITTQDVDKGVPGLKDAPLFKWLFSSVDDTKKMEDVLIFITPHILKNWFSNELGKS